MAGRPRLRNGPGHCCPPCNGWGRSFLAAVVYFLLRPIRMRQRSFMVEHAAEIPAIDPAAASLAFHEVVGIVTIAANWSADELAARDYPIFVKIVRYFGHHDFGCIAGRARRSGTAAGTGTRSFPRPLRMVLADPSVIIAARAVSHGKDPSPLAVDLLFQDRRRFEDDYATRRNHRPRASFRVSTAGALTSLANFPHSLCLCSGPRHN
jgi:hypothetical protein